MSLADGAGTDIAGMEPGEGGEGTGQAQETAPESDAVPAPEPVAAPAERVSIAPPGRRGKAKGDWDKITTEIASLKESTKTRDAEYQRELSARDAELHRLRGVTDALAPMLQNLRQGPPPPQVTADQLFREAEKALDDKDIGAYQRKFAEAVKLQVLDAVPKQQQVQQQPQMNPIVGAMLAQHPKVLQAGDRGMALAAAHDNVLAAQGIPATPDRWKKAIELADQSLGGTPYAGPSQSQREVLSGIPTARASGAGREEGPGVELTPMEQHWQQLSGMPKEEYAKLIVEANPSRLKR